jgi:adenylate cyclase
LGSNVSFKHRFFSPKIFGLVIGLIVFVFFLIFGMYFDGLENLEIQLMDLHFNLKNTWQVQDRGAGYTEEIKSTRLSNDIVIIGVDNRSLEQFGRWPFPRRIHADLMNSFTRIKDQNQRESVVLLDFLFNEKADRAFEDVLLLKSITDNGNVALQTLHSVMPIATTSRDELTKRFDILLRNYGEIRNISGDLSDVVANYGIESPLQPYGGVIAAFGHASYGADDDKTYRRQQLVSRYSLPVNEYTLDNIRLNTNFGIRGRGHLAWDNNHGVAEVVELPLTPEKLDTLVRDNQKRGLLRGDTNTYTVKSYEDHFVPAISLTLALQYFNKTLDDIEVVYGSHILIHSPMKWDSNSGVWAPYLVPGKNAAGDIRIPIDNSGNMLINFMGGKSSTNPAEYQTFPVRSYARFAGLAPGSNPESWSKTNGFGGKVVMVGAFTLGMADDEKPTPMGLMFGVEIHANALNTIIMENYISKPAAWMSSLAMLALILIFAFITSRMKRLGWSAGILVFFVIISFLIVTILFDKRGLLIDWGTPIISVITTFVAVVIYRVLTAERDKRQIKGVFGQFIAPELVEELAIAPPKLGGEYINGTVLFSDIRGFSYLSERLSAEELVDLLNEYLTLMTDNMVNEFGGTLDKYIGDAIMAFWGAPKPLEDHAIRACKSAVAQIRILNKYNPTFREKYQNKIAIGIGINSGDKLSESLMVSYMGSEGRKNYTAMGDTVNLASRLEGVNKEYRTTILISEDTYDMIKDEKFIVRELDEIRVKGRNKPVTIYELVDYDGELAGVPKEELVSGEQG